MHNTEKNLFQFIKQRVSILDVINEHVSLKKAGHYWKGQCPFHDEKTASFSVSPHREIFYCFGCHAGGDVITFLAKIENCSNIDAAKQLADRYSVEIPETILHQVSTESADEKKRYFELCKIITQWAHEQLQKNPSIAQYLEKRGFTQESINNFEVGYIPGGTRSLQQLIKQLNTHNFLVKDLLDVHLAEETKGSIYSPFEQRIIFPIKDHLGRHCGFGGRIIKENDQRAKYYNSRENNFFQKGSLLFGLDAAKKAIQKTGQAFLVEGYTDCIAMAQYGFTNTVATLGTACTLEHLKQLSYHAKTVFVLYDGDTAGQKAMLRLAQLCWQVNLDLKTIFLPTGQDPASFLSSGGNLTELINQAKDILLFFLECTGKEFANQSLQEKLMGTRKILEIIKHLDDPLKQDILLQNTATIFQIPFESLKNELKRVKASPKNFSDPQQEFTVPPEPVLGITILPIEKKFLSAILSDNGLLRKKEVIQLLAYISPEIRAIVEKIQTFEAPFTKDTFMLFFDTLEYWQKQLVNQIMLSQDEQEEFERVLLMLEKKYWKTIVSDTKLKITVAQQENNAEKVNDIMISFLELKKKLLRKGLI